MSTKEPATNTFTYRIIAFSLSVCLLAAAAYVEAQAQLLGFPDGFLSDRDRAARVIATLFVWGSTLTALCVAVLGWRARQNATRGLALVVTLYVVFALVLLGCLIYVQQFMDSGIG